jgi:prepilin-type N-terminal cleavage/methylation domain-containing protein
VNARAFQGSVRLRAAFTLVELLVVIAIIALLIAILLPSIQSARESARRIQCANNVKQLGMALLNYHQANGNFPVGSVSQDVANWGFSPWDDAQAASGAGLQGTSWMLAILPQIEQTPLYNQWNFSTNVLGNAVSAQQNIAGFYCPSRRSGLRPGDSNRLINAAWTGGGTDYGGCAGGGNLFVNTVPHAWSANTNGSDNWNQNLRAGAFRPNQRVAIANMLDGTSNTILVGELQRLTVTNPIPDRASQDGWAVGGMATLFSTNDKELSCSSNCRQTGGMNNFFFENPGSDHSGGATLGMADGSTHFISENVDSILLRLLGCMKSGEDKSVPQ